MITSGFTYIAVLMFLAGGLLALEKYAKWKVFNVVPPLVWIYVINMILCTCLLYTSQRSFPEEPGEISPKKQAAVVLAAALLIGSYDGFYGPGTGTFLLLIFTRWGKMDVRTAGGNVKVVNLASGLSSMVTAMLHGQVFWQLGLIATVASFAGHFVGAGLAIKNGSRIVRPVVLVVLVLLAVKVLSGLL